MNRLSTLHTTIVIGLACLTLLACVPSVFGQASRTGAVGRRLDDFNRQGDQAARDEMEREMHGRKPTAEERRQAEVKMAQMKEDFETLQSIYNELVMKLQAKESMGDDYVIEIGSRILKSGSRLRTSIEFPEKQLHDEKTDPGPAPHASLKIICVQLHAFLTNPMFETAVLDITEAVKARDSLDKIIETATNLRRQLGKID